MGVVGIVLSAFICTAIAGTVFSLMLPGTGVGTVAAISVMGAFLLAAIYGQKKS